MSKPKSPIATADIATAEAGTLFYKPIITMGNRALIREKATRGRETHYLPFSSLRINPNYNGRIGSLTEGMDDLVEFILQYGLPQPLTVDFDAKGIAWIDQGHRRHHALGIIKERGLLKKLDKPGIKDGAIECFVNTKVAEPIDKLVSQYTSNNKGVPFNDQEVAQLCRRLHESPFNLKPEEIATKLVISRGGVNNFLLLAGCSQETFDAIKDGTTNPTAVVAAMRVLKSPDQVDEEIRKVKANNKKFTVGDANLLRKQSSEASAEMNPELELGAGDQSDNDNETTVDEAFAGGVQAAVIAESNDWQKMIALKDKAIDYLSGNVTEGLQEWLSQQPETVKALYWIIQEPFVSTSSMLIGMSYYDTTDEKVSVCVCHQDPSLHSAVTIPYKDKGRKNKFDYEHSYVTELTYKEIGKDICALLRAKGFGYNNDFVSTFLNNRQLGIYGKLSKAIMDSFVPGSSLRIDVDKCGFLTINKHVDGDYILAEIMDSSLGAKRESKVFRMKSGDYSIGSIYENLIIADRTRPEVKPVEKQERQPRLKDELKLDPTREEIIWCNNIIGNLDKIETILKSTDLPEGTKNDIERYIGFSHKDMEQLRTWVHKNARS